jgi:radical SAM-linked protein
MRGTDGFPTRLRFGKHGKVRFVGHRDVARCFERAFRIEALPLAFTEGFVPRPKVSFGLALTVGYESDAEYLDVELVTPSDVDALVPSLSAALPEGIDVTGAALLEDRAPALQEAVTAAAYHVEVVNDDGSAPDVAVVTDAVTHAIERSELPATRVRKGRSVVEDIRPALRRLAVLDRTDLGVALDLEVATQPRGIRPGEVLGALGAGFVEGRVRRTNQWIERGGARLEPLDADARSRAVEARAS